MKALVPISPVWMLPMKITNLRLMEPDTVDHGDKFPGRNPHEKAQDSSPEELVPDFSDRAPLATRIRVILGLSLLSWFLVAAAIWWVIRRF